MNASHPPSSILVVDFNRVPDHWPKNVIWRTPQQLDDERNARLTEQAANGQRITRRGCPLGDLDFSDHGKRTTRRQR